MKQFQEQNLFQPAAQSQGFEPVKAPDVSGLLRQNNQARLQEAKMFADQRMADLKLEEQSLKYQELLEREEVGRLADFSQTLSDVLVQQAEARNEREEQRGLMLAYTDGIDPQDAADFDAQEATLQAGTTLAYDEGGKLEAQGLPVDAVKSVRNLTGWAKYGYMRGMAEQAGANYGTFYTQAAQSLEVNVNGETFTLLTAQNGPQRAAAKAAIAERYMQQYGGMNPALLNKYLFPKMKSWERQDDIQWADKQRKEFEALKQEELKDGLFSAVDAVNPGEAVLNLIELHKGTFGSRTVAITKTLEQLHKMAELGVLTEDQYELILKQKTTRLDSGQPTTFGELFERRLEFLEFDKAFAKAKGDTRTLDREEELQQLFELEKQFEEDVERNGGFGKVPEELLTRYQEQYEQITGKQTEWDVVAEMKSALDTDVETELANITSLMNSRGPAQYLTESEYARLLPEVREKLPKNIKIISDSAGMNPSSANFTEVSTRANQLAKIRHNRIGVNENHTPESFYFAENAKKFYQDEYLKEFNQHGNAELAHSNAMLAMNQKGSVSMGKDDEGNEKYEFDALPIYKMRKTDGPNIVGLARKEIIAGADWRTDKLYSLGPNESLIRGGTSAITQLEKWANSGGKGPIPSVWQAMAVGQRGVNAWDIAAAQYKLHTGKDLKIPGVERKVRELNPNSKILLMSHTSPGRTSRAALQEGGINKFADLVGYHESSAHGGYDAMNTGGSGMGYNNRAYGSANSKDVFGKGISQMTVGEVLQLGREKRIFAAGRYQFIPSTLQMVVDREGIDPDTKFDKNTQDFLFASQVRYRLKTHQYGGLIQGMRTEWQGLYYASEQQIRSGLEAFQDSPFNDPQYLHPALLQNKGGK